MEQDQIVKGYDPAIMRRLLGYLRPYRLSVFFAVVGLIVATGAELLTPVVLQQAIDQHLVVSHLRMPLETVDEIDELVVEESDPVIEGYVYINANRLTVVTGVRRDELIEAGFLESREYYLARIDDESSQEVVANNQDLFADEGPWAAIATEDLEELSEDELTVIRRDDLAGLDARALEFLVLLVAVLVFTFVQVYLMAYTGQGVMKDMRLSLFSHMTSQSLSYLSRHPVGKLVTRVTNDVETVNELFTTVIISLVKDVALMVGVVVALFLLSPSLALVTILSLPPVLILTAIFRKRARDAFRRVRMWVSRVNAFLSEHISGMAVVQIFAREQRTQERFEKDSTELMKANLGEMYVFAVFRPLIDLLSSVSIGVVIYFGAGFFLEGIVSLGVLIAFINLIQRFYRPVMDISEKFTILQSAMAGSERVFQLLDDVDRIPDTGERHLPSPPAGRIEFDHVHFAYKKGEPVIRDLSFSVDPGETVAIVGYTGAGKTTIANLLTRMWDIDEGSIRVDGVDIRDVPLAELRTRIQPIQQDVFLFSESVASNIALGLPLPREAVRHAATVVQADGFISTMDAGYDTPLNEGATNISTGQRQLISFARVIAHDPRIIVLDEATANIDTETERLIQEAMRVVLKDRTSLVIAHRLSTIKHSDRILVLSHGQLVEEGSHDELIARRGVYYNLYRLQYSGAN